PELRRKTRRFYCRSWIQRAARALGDGLISRMVRPMTVGSPPSHTVHFLASLTHVQRADAVRRLSRSSLRWRGGITSVPAFVGGLDDGIRALSPGEQWTLTDKLREEGLLTPPV